MSVQPLLPHHHPHRSWADPHARLSAALVLSVVLWTPFGLAAARGELDLVAAGLRYLVAFLGCRVAVSGIAHLVASYHAGLQPLPDTAGVVAGGSDDEAAILERHRRAEDAIS